MVLVFMQALLQGVQLFLPDHTFHEDDVIATLGGYMIHTPQRPKTVQPPPKWDEAPNCWKCRVQFSFTVRQHHCRNWFVSCPFVTGCSD